MEALIKPWRASGPSAPCWSMPASFCRKKPWVQCWAFMVPRLQGTAALQVNVAFQGGMASAFAKASADTSVPSQF